MKQNLLVLAAMIVTILFFIPHNAGAQCPPEPNDLGICDTLYVETFNCDHEYEADSGSFDSVRVALYVTHDSNTFWYAGESKWVQDSVRGFVVPLTFWHQPEGCADSVILPNWDNWNNTAVNPVDPQMNRSIFRDIVDEHTSDTVYNRMLWLASQFQGLEWDIRILDIESHSSDGDSGHAWLAVIPSGMANRAWWEGERVLLATLTFHVYMSEDCDTTEIGLDSTFWPPLNQLAFNRYDAVLYSPRHFLPVKDTIYILPQEQMCCQFPDTTCAMMPPEDCLGAGGIPTPGVPCSDDGWCKDTVDLGVPDTLYVETFDCDHYYQADSGSFDSVRVAIYVTHDSNTFYSDLYGKWVQDSIAAFVVPLNFWHQPEGCADSVILPNWDNWNNTAMHPADPRMPRSLFRHIVDSHTGDTVYNRLLQMVEAGKDAWMVTTDIESHSCDGDSGHVFLSLIAAAANCQRWWEGERELLATLTFHVYMSEDCDTTEIGLDSTSWPPSYYSVTFVRYDAVEYSPRHFLPVKDTIYYAAFVDVTAGEDQTGATKEDVSVMFYIQNTGPSTETYDLDATSSLGWYIDPPESVLTLDPGEIDSVWFAVSIPNVPLGTSSRVTLEAAPQTYPYWGDSDSLTVTCDYYGIEILQIADVPNDQGKQVRIEWLSFTDFDSSVTSFTIFRQIDSLLVASGVSGHELLEASESSFWFDYPPGRWEVVGTIPAFGETLYATIVPTLKDSTIAEGMYYSVFFIRAGTDNPYVYYDSPIDSGYSVDNLLPSSPTGLFASHQEVATKLTWSPTSASDFDYYTLYRDTLSGFEPDSSNRLGFTIDTTFLDSTAELGVTYYYVVSATDFSGNESDPSNEAMGVRYITGDANGDGVIDAADVVSLINCLFVPGAPCPEPLEAGDVTCDGIIDSADVVCTINHLFAGGPLPCC